MIGFDLKPRDVVVRELAIEAASTQKGIIAVSDFTNVFLDAIEKKQAGVYTASDKKQLADVYEKAVDNADDRERFANYFGYICKTYDFM